MLSKVLIQLSADRWDCTPSLVVVWPEVTKPWGLWLYGRVNGELQEGLHQGGPSSTPIPVMSPADPHLHRRPSNTRRQFWVSLLWGHCCSSLGLGACNILFVLSKTTVLVSPSTLEVLQSNPAGPQAQIPWGFQVPLLHPQAGKPDVGSGPSQQWENFFGIIVLQSVGHPPRGYRIDFIVIVPLLLSCYIFFFVFGHGFLFCLFVCLFVFGDFQHPPVDGCSTDRCNFGALGGGNEHRSFYSTVWNQKPCGWYLPLGKGPQLRLRWKNIGNC